ncbi:hypothetical protein [Methylobacterium sp. Leaf106]|uniref:hypothetical protein n=1 Tax=Methylobacterium sp. Leaf106 TaxID=1736255 RepID=UPI000AEB3CC7|nr:hypothetical protein [Methylobacterium sp. Leaf106]
MPDLVDPGAASVAALILNARTLLALVDKKVLTQAEAEAIIQATANQVASAPGADEGKKVLKTIFPQMNF